MTAMRPLQNRVTPLQGIVRDPARGMFMGNRGGKIHDPVTKALLPSRRWTSRRWIICVTEFKNRQRQVMGNSYTELFFLDEATALSAGHRPCYECRRADAKAFAEAAAKGLGIDRTPSADELDRLLHWDRLDGRTQCVSTSPAHSLPDGCMIRLGDVPALVYRQEAYIWQMNGYQSEPVPLPDGHVPVLTPRITVAALSAGYRPVLHGSLGAIDP